MSRWILVTGCSSGIGLDAAIALHQRGYNVIATIRHIDQAEPLFAAGLKHVVVLDLSLSSSVQATAERCLEISNGEITALFNNAAYGQPGAVEDLSRDVLRKQFETNLFGVQELTNLLLPTFLAHSDARIVNCSSVLGIVAMPFRGAYNASKFALEGLTDTLRMELVGTSVKVVLIEPGPIITRFRENALTALQENIDIDASRHQEGYKKNIARLEKPGAAMPFTLGPEEVTKKLIKALECRNPKARYYVTFPTHLMGFLRRVLPTSLLDKFLRRG